VIWRLIQALSWLQAAAEEIADRIRRRPGEMQIFRQTSPNEAFCIISLPWLVKTSMGVKHWADPKIITGFIFHGHSWGEPAFPNQAVLKA